MLKSRLPAGLTLAWLCLAAGCASPRPITPQARAFVFGHDTFAYPNELLWIYYFDDQGKWSHRRNEPRPDYTHHCFVLVRSAKQFFLNARFDPHQPVATDATYRRLVRAVQRSDPRNAACDAAKIVIPGYANLQEFSAARERVLKEECGSFWQSYFQRGHWRMIFHFSRNHQDQMAGQLLASVRAHRPAVVHIACFPSLRINHALLLFEAEETATEIRFAAYDPNDAGAPTALTFDRARRAFRYPTNRYFPGGDVSVYEVYVSRCY
jgi:hypothetical protein